MLAPNLSHYPLRVNANYLIFSPARADSHAALCYKRLEMAYPPASYVYGGIQLLGSSLAGEETYVVVPEMNLSFDVGRAPREVVTVDHVFLTHGHMDHAAGLAYYFSQRMFIDQRPGTLYAPAPLIAPVSKLLRIWADIDGHEPPAVLNAAEPGVDIVLRRDLVIRPFRVNHPSRRHDHTRVEALGFAAIEVRQKLKDEFAGLPGPKLVELKQQGIEIVRRIEVPLIAYCGDTAPGDFLDLPWVAEARILVLECTFVEPDHRDRARAGGHFHLDDLRAAFPALRNERIVLTHLSRRTPMSFAQRMLRKALGPAALERVSFLMSHARATVEPEIPDALPSRSQPSQRLDSSTP